MAGSLVMLDLDNTLADRQAAFEYWLDQLVAAHPQLDAHRAWIAELDDDGYRDREVFLGEVRRRFALETDVAALLREYRRRTTEGFRPVGADVLGRLAEVRRRGAKLAIVTNGDADAQRATVSRTGLAPYVDAVVISGAVGVRKPDRAIFELAGEWCATGLDAAWMIGDGDADIEALDLWLAHADGDA